MKIFFWLALVILITSIMVALDQHVPYVWIFGGAGIFCFLVLMIAWRYRRRLKRQLPVSMKIAVVGAKGHGKTAWIARAIYEWANDLSEDDPTKKIIRGLLHDNENNQIPESNNIGEYSHSTESGQVSVVWQDVAGNNLFNPNALEKIRLELLPKAHGVVWALDVQQGLFLTDPDSTAPIHSDVEKTKQIIQERWNKDKKLNRSFPVWTIYTKKDCLSPTAPDYTHQCDSLQKFAQRIHAIPLDSQDAYFLSDKPPATGFDLLSTKRQFKQEWQEQIVPGVQRFYTKVAIQWKKDVAQQQKNLVRNRRWVWIWLILTIYLMMECWAYYTFGELNKISEEGFAGDMQAFEQLQQHAQSWSPLASFYIHRRDHLMDKVKKVYDKLLPQTEKKLADLDTLLAILPPTIQEEDGSLEQWNKYITDLDELYDKMELIKTANAMLAAPQDKYNELNQHLDALNRWIMLIHPEWKDDLVPQENLRMRLLFLRNLPRHIQPLRSQIVQGLTLELQHQLAQLQKQAEKIKERPFWRVEQFDKLRMLWEETYAMSDNPQEIKPKFSDDFTELAKTWRELQIKNWDEVWKYYDQVTSPPPVQMKMLDEFYHCSQDIRFSMVAVAEESSYQMWPKTIYEQWTAATERILGIGDPCTQTWKNLKDDLPISKRMLIADIGFDKRMSFLIRKYFTAKQSVADTQLANLELEYNNHQKDCEDMQKAWQSRQQKNAGTSDSQPTTIDPKNAGGPDSQPAANAPKNASTPDLQPAAIFPKLELWRQNLTTLKQIVPSQQYKVTVNIRRFGCLNPNPQTWKDDLKDKWGKGYFYLKFIPSDNSYQIVDQEGSREVEKCSFQATFTWQPWQKMSVIWYDKDGDIDPPQEENDDDEVHKHESATVLSLWDISEFEDRISDEMYWVNMNITNITPPIAPELLDLWKTYIKGRP